MAPRWAHPSYPDRAGFGRRELEMPAVDLAAAIDAQLVALARAARRLGARLAHVKPHGVRERIEAAGVAIVPL